MRLTTDFWVSALLRRVFGEGGFGAILNRGALEAGAVFILTRDRFGRSNLYGPAPQTSYDMARPGERQFSLLESDDDGAAIEKRLERERRFDPDIWVVEIEPGKTEIVDLVSLTTP
ncbi:hypothetical protein EDC40_101535 [Aminobacter aminovorans]|jgi:hypothetical protein|uniref:Protein of uncharacterized function (DUF1491) n=1 Tax=Aminobacter aminovorans TaxID=83263 RepID=A0A380WRZ3_AMIAI|nr:DUF1491 family protein [Aminobacter aminovorans]TCS30217.1 hypothetical protein EDC40_101535 [Aminobacter aminovorans]SUU91066.1 Protein of uncharacterised function (DUF1491) [Aminobacter aminovorans]